MINWDIEWPTIVNAARAKFVDPRFVRAIRQQENGGPGREFGVLSVPAPDFGTQLSICVTTVAHLSYRFDATNPPVLEYEPGIGTFYTSQFVTYFGRIWAPMKAANDPDGLNASWIKNVGEIYMGLVKP